jgi:hypothetical protein
VTYLRAIRVRLSDDCRNCSASLNDSYLCSWARSIRLSESTYNPNAIIRASSIAIASKASRDAERNQFPMRDLLVTAFFGLKSSQSIP